MDMVKELFVSGALKHLWYILKPTKDEEELGQKAKCLLAIRDDLNQQMRNKMGLPTNSCNLFLEGVEKMENKVNAIKEECTEFNNHLYLNIYSRVKLGKRIRETIEDIDALESHHKRFKGEEFVVAPQKVEPQPSPKIQDTSSSARTLLQTCESIKDVNIHKIGIWGMGGIGKTTIMQSVNNHPEMKNMFDTIIWVTVSKGKNRRDVQNTIASRLKLDISKEPDDRVRYSIQKELERRKFLLLLDDVWQMIDLADVGVPVLNCENGCKVVLTTRELRVCREMETNKDMKVEILSKDEAWHLFQEKAGDVASKHEIEPIAKSIVKECGGLPLAIIVVGSSLRKTNDTIIWKNALRTISESHDMGERVFGILKYSYLQLPTEGHKALFRYCALYPEDTKIILSELKEHCWVEGFVDVKGGVEKARDNAHCMIEDLVGSSLLERCWIYKENNSVKMHDVIRDLALRLSPKFFVGSKHGKKWKRSEKMFLLASGLDPLPKNPNCPSLSTLFLKEQHWLFPLNIPKSFFEKMPTLGVLDLSGTFIESLPSSIQYLVNLRALFLKNCRNLRRLPSEVGALKRLEVLDRSGYIGLEVLPKEIGELSRLKCLRVTLSAKHGFAIKVGIPVGIIGRLSLLEELSINFDPLIVDWDGESMKLICKQELWKLKNLTCLEFYFPDVECLNHFVRFNHSWKACSLTRFRFCVGGYIRKVTPPLKVDRELVWTGGDAIAAVVVSKLLGRCEGLVLIGDRSERKLPTLGLKEMAGLKYLSITGCCEIQTLHNYSDEEPPAAVVLLPNLESLLLHILPKLKSLWFGAPLLAPGSFSKLTSLSFSGCDNLKAAIPWAALQCFQCLEDLDVENCKSMEEIIVMGNEGDQEQGTTSSYHEEQHHHHHDTDLLIIPKLKKLHLAHLPHLASNGICRCALVKWPSLEVLEIVYCPKVRDLSITNRSSNSHHPHHHDTTPILPKLKKLFLDGLPELDSIGICRGESVEWPSLEQIHIIDCPNVKDLSFITKSSVPAPNLHTICGKKSWWSELNIQGTEKERLAKLFKR